MIRDGHVSVSDSVGYKRYIGMLSVVSMTAHEQITPSSIPGAFSKMPRPIKVAIVQFASHQHGDPHETPNTERNFDRVAKYIQQAGEAKADFVVFPEYFITGVMADALHLADDEEGGWLNEISGLAKQHNIDVVAGTIVERSKENNEHLFNQSVPPPGLLATQSSYNDVFLAVLTI